MKTQMKIISAVSIAVIGLLLYINSGNAENVGLGVGTPSTAYSAASLGTSSTATQNVVLVNTSGRHMLAVSVASGAGVAAQTGTVTVTVQRSVDAVNYEAQGTITLTEGGTSAALATGTITCNGYTCFKITTIAHTLASAPATNILVSSHFGD